MRFLNIVSAAVAAAPLAVSAATGKLGYAIGDKKPDGNCKFTADYEADFDVINAQFVRTYSSSECSTAEQILPAAAKKGVKVILGVWPDTDEAYNADKAALQSAVPANSDSVYAITVGSEALYRGNLKGPELLTKIKDIQDTFPNIKVGTADSWNKYADGTADAVIQGGVKILLVNAFAFWQGQEIGNATATYLDDLMQAFTRIQHISGSTDAIELWNGETGWPTTGGTDYGSAVAGTSNAKTFFAKGVCAALDWGFNVFYFEAFDEPWKPDSIGDTGAKSNEKHWGAYTAEGAAKFPLNSSTASSGLATLSRHIGAPDCSDTLWASSVVEASSNVHSRSSSVWTAPSPSRAFNFPSPRLPSLPKNSELLNYSHASLSPAPHHRSDSSTYYTALWGSPASPEVLQGKHHHQRSFSIVTADGSPSPRVRSNVFQGVTLPQGRRIASGVKRENHTGLFGPQRISAVGVASPLGQRHSRQGFTEDWLKTGLTDPIRTERVHWWSDESENSDKQSSYPSSIAASPYPGGNWLQLDGAITRPRLLSITQNKPIQVFGGNESEDNFTHGQDFSRSTFKQRNRSAINQDLPEMLESQPIRDSSATMFDPLSAGRQTSQDRTSTSGMQIAEKPLPPPPPQFDRTITEAPPPTPIKSSITAQSSFQRSRKRVVWRGKACIIALPAGDEHWNRNNRGKLLKPQDVKDRLETWESQGYQTKGFKLSSLFEGHVPCSSDGQSRAIYPGPEDEQLERTDRNFRVNIPDRREWEDYVNDLKENKLRALGVSFAEDESSKRDSPGISLMSRHASSQSSAMPISPSLATSIISTHNSQHLNRFSVPFPGPTNSGPQASMLYNASQPQAKPTGSNFSRYSMALPNSEQGLPSSYQYPPAQSPLLGSWPTQQYFKSHPSSRVTSPAVNGHMQSVGSALSPLALSASDHSNQASNDLLPQMRQQQAQIQTQLLHQQQQQQQLLHLRPLQKTTNVRNQVEPPKLSDHGKQPDIVTPIPRGHRQNLSETLQKEVDEAELQMQDSERRTNGDTDKDLESDIEGKGGHIDELPVLANILRGVDKGFNSDGSDLDTNPSLSSTPKPAKIPSGNNHRSHKSKSSLSKLNVNAPEFIYEPKKSFAPDVFAFLGDQTDPQPSANTTLQVTVLKNPESAAKSSLNSTNLNVAAPSFTPGNVPKPLTPSRVFSFSSGGPAFKPEAPSFKPNETNTTITDKTVASNEPSGRKIFGDINLSGMVKPARKSRAIPIIKPKDTHEGDDQDPDGQEDESGRITQADGRQKRMRRGDGDSNQIPLFAIPGIEIPSRVEDITPPEKAKSQNPEPGVQEATTTLEKATNQLKEIIDDLPGSDASSLMGDHEAVDAGGKSWEPFSFSDANDAAIFNAARSILPSLGHSPGDDAKRITKVEQEVFRVQSDQTLASPRVGSEVHVHGISSAIRNVGIDSLPASTDIHEFQKSGSVSELSPSITAKELPSPRRKVISGSSHTGSHSSALIDYQTEPAEELSEETQHLEVRDPFSAGPADDVSYLDQSYNEIDAVMKHLNNEDSDLGVERNVGPWRTRSPIRTPLALLHDKSGVLQLLPVPHARSAAPSPSPNRLQQPFQYLPKSDSESASTAEVEMVARNARFSPSYRPSKTSLNSDHPIHRLNSPSNLPVSDWDDVMSSADEAKFLSRTGFFDHRINDLVGGIVQQRLSPLERALAGIQDSLGALTSRSASRRHRSSTSAEIEHSDADDEDDPEASQSKVMSPARDRKYEKIKASIAEMTAAQQNFASISEVSEILEIVKDLKTMHRSSPPSGDIKTVIEEVVAKQLRGRSKPITSSHESATVEKNQLQIAGLESMLKIADARADDELKARRATEDALADSQRLLRMAMQEAAEQRESAEETERSLSTFHDERLHVLRRTAVLEGAQESLQKTASDLTEKNAALEGTLEEYRLSRAQWREEVEEAKAENRDLQNTITVLKVEIEDSIRGRQTLRTKFDRLQEDMTQASRDIARDQSIWRKREEENKARLELLDAKLEAESDTREKLEHEIVGFLAQEKDAAKVRHAFEQSQQDNTRLNGLVNDLRVQSQEHQKSITRYECELHDARESAKLEVHRIRSAMGADIEIANNQVNTVRSDLERVISRLQSELDEITTQVASNKAKYEVMLEEASDSRNIALREAAEAREAALQGHYRFHESTLEESKAKYERELKNVLEDKQRSEIHLNDRLALADEKIRYLEERTTHLEEKLEIAKAAAQQLAAQSKKAGSSPSASRTAIPLGRGSDVHERISPQALRESIMVLQEQLQEREGRIEQLEQAHSEIDKDAPAKLKDQEIEIAWLRELLGVRIDDLEDIIVTLSQPSYDREAMKDAAIRLKANLQMEQQEKERALAIGQKFPSFPSISTLASSPRALPLAAAAAWGNWRKARDNSFGSLSGIASGSPSQTPSRSSPSAQGFLSGLLTPPETKIRQTPQPGQSTRPSGMTSAASKKPTGAYRTPRQSLSLRDESRSLRPPQSPATPPLMRKASYDGDADSMGFGEDRSDAHYLLSEGKAGDEPFESSMKAFPDRV